MDAIVGHIEDAIVTFLNYEKGLEIAFRNWKKEFLAYAETMKAKGFDQYSTAESAFSDWANGILDKNFIDHKDIDMKLVFFILVCTVFTIIALILSCCCFRCCCGKKGRKSSKKTVTFLGLSNSGKTSLLLHMIHGKECEARMSQMENDIPFVNVTDSFSNRSVGIRIIDVPGNERVRTNWNKYASESTVVVFFINSVDFVAQSRQAAEYLYDVLTLPEMQKKKTPIIIFCNKCDLDTAKSVNTIRKGLEDQLQQLIEASAIDIDQRLSPTYDNGDEQEHFSFENTVCPVSFITGSARRGVYSELVDTILHL